jgi:hypothetical protein
MKNARTVIRERSDMINGTKELDWNQIENSTENSEYERYINAVKKEIYSAFNIISIPVIKKDGE